MDVVAYVVGTAVTAVIFLTYLKHAQDWPVGFRCTGDQILSALAQRLRGLLDSFTRVAQALTKQHSKARSAYRRATGALCGEELNISESRTEHTAGCRWCEIGGSCASLGGA